MNDKIKKGQEKRIQKLIEKGIYKIHKYQKCICEQCNKEFDKEITSNKLYLQFNFCSSQCFKNNGLYYKIIQEKRRQKLIESGKIHVPNIENIKCLQCEKEFVRDLNKDTKYKINGYCCLKCFIQSGKYQIIKITTELENKGYNLENKTIEEIYNLYSKYISERNKDENIYNKWLNSNKENWGEDFAVKRSILGHKTFRKKFLLENNLISEEKINDLSEKDLQKIFINNYNKISKHGESIKNGRLKKYDYDLEKYKQSYINGLINQIINKIKNDYNIDKLSESEYIEIFNKYEKWVRSESRKIKKTKDKLINWKISNLKHLNIEINNLSEKEINNLYSSYLSSRFKNLVNSEKNGYRGTLKGWYNFKNVKRKLFYRSSWELEVFKNIDDLILEKEILDVKIPEPIIYYYEFKRKYFPDIEIIFPNNKNIIIEIKPFSKLKDKINILKFKYAKKIYKNKFKILTEKEIFNIKLKEIIINYK